MKYTRRGQSLVEFAVVALVTYMLLAAIFTFGHALFAAQQAQSVVDFAAREVSRTPFQAETPLHDPTGTTPDILYGDASSDPAVADFRLNVFDPFYLVLNIDGMTADEVRAGINALPSVNRMLTGLMISDQVDGQSVLRYPGALYQDGSKTPPASPVMPILNYLVTIPIVIGRASDGVETLTFAPVLEEIETHPFPLSSQDRGLVALRINYPFQSAAMSSFRPNPDGPFEPTIGNPNAADDAGVTVQGDAPGTFVAPDIQGPHATYAGTHGGTYGLGAQGAMSTLAGGRPIRPYRRVLSFQAVYRREIFQ